MATGAGPQCPALDNTSVLLLVLIRECKINKTMLIKVGVPAIVRMLQHHRNPVVSATAVQALSGVLTLLTMSKTMLDLVLQLGGLKLVLELLVYEAHPSDSDDDVAVRNAPPCLESCCFLYRMFCHNYRPGCDRTRFAVARPTANRVCVMSFVRIPMSLYIESFGQVRSLLSVPGYTLSRDHIKLSQPVASFSAAALLSPCMLSDRPDGFCQDLSCQL